MRFANFATLALVVAACRVVAPSDYPVGDAGPAARAEAVCGHLRALGCPEGNPSPKGETCEIVVARDADAIDGRCVVAAQTTADLQECAPVVRCGAR